MEFYIKLSNNLSQANLIKLNSASTQNSAYEALNHLIQAEFDLTASDYDLISTSGVLINSNSLIQNGQTFQICPKVLGGKGGFGSLLRAFGKQITRSTDKGACRDLTGRRIRNVKNEQRLKEFLSNQAELKKQKEEEKKAKEERRRKKREKIEAKHHMFVDPKYDEQKQKIAQDLDEAILKGVENKAKQQASDDSSPKTSSSESNGETELAVKEVTATIKEAVKEQVKVVEVKKKEVTSTVLKDWMGVGDIEVSSSDEDEEEVPVKKAKSN